MIKCPSCSALLYSRTSGICPECKTALPQDMQLSMEEKIQQKMEQEKFKLMVGDLKDSSRKKGSFLANPLSGLV